MLTIKNLIVTIYSVGILSGAIYPVSAVVVDVDYEYDMVTIEDKCGNLYQFCGAEDWYKGDYANAIFFDMGTPTVKDDVILSVRYEGYQGMEIEIHE